MSVHQLSEQEQLRREKLAELIMMGIEPYLKIPIEGIGWSDLKLYSVGASFTLRYIILNQKKSAVAVPSHGPD